MKEILAVHKRVSVSELMLQFFFLKGGILNCPKVYGLSGFYKLVSLSNIFSMDKIDVKSIVLSAIYAII